MTSTYFRIFILIRSPGYISEFVENFAAWIFRLVIPKVIGGISEVLNDCSLFEINLLLGRLTQRDAIDMWFKLV